MTMKHLYGFKWPLSRTAKLSLDYIMRSFIVALFFLFTFLSLPLNVVYFMNNVIWSLSPIRFFHNNIILFCGFFWDCSAKVTDDDDWLSRKWKRKNLQWPLKIFFLNILFCQTNNKLLLSFGMFWLDWMNIHL